MNEDDRLLNKQEKMVEKTDKRKKDRSMFSTVDKVLDHTSLSVLTKLQNRGCISDLSGSVSSGKEANIYTAYCSTALVSKFIQPEGLPDAHSSIPLDASSQSGASSQSSSPAHTTIPAVIKIYKTSAMLFKDRERYIADEKRFSNFCTSNSRKLIKLWAEKEVRNLKRLAKHGIPCPRPIYLKKSVLIMSMIGDGSPAPRLRDAVVSDWPAVYLECVDILHSLFSRAGLIHADFSEYNLLYHRNRVYVIDVGQSIERDQENAHNFLAMDIRNCNDFFSRKGVPVRTEADLFQSITGLQIPRYLRTEDGKLSRDSFIPSRLADVVNHEDYELFLLNGQMIQRLSSDTVAGTTSRVTASDEIRTSDESNDSDKSDEGNSDDTLSVSDTADGNSSCEMGDSTSDVDGETGSATQKMNIYMRKLRLKNPAVTEEEEKEYNRRRKQVVKEMNRERRTLRAVKSEIIRKQKSKKSQKRK